LITVGKLAAKGMMKKPNDTTSQLKALFKESDKEENTSIIWLSVSDVIVAKQIREQFEDEDSSLQELAESIKAHGLLQPILVRPGQFGHFELIAGERRLRAHKLAGILQIPAFVKTMSDEDAEDAQLAENIQRKNLTQIEEAKKIQADLNKLGSVQAVLKKHNKSKSWYSKIMGLLELQEQAKRLITENISADTEIISQVKMIEKIDPEKAKDLVNVLKASHGKNARNIVAAVKEEVKPSDDKKLGKPLKDLSNIATKKDKSAQLPSEVVSIFPETIESSVSVPEQQLSKIFFGEIEFEVLRDEEKEAIEAYLREFYDEGLIAESGKKNLLKKLRSGIFGVDGAKAFSLLAFVQGLEKSPSFDLVDLIQIVRNK
jgi:ParB family chromosome partitioning protein